MLANRKKIFVKSPAAIELFKSKAPDTLLPAVSVITQWGALFDAIVCYEKNFEIFCSERNEFDRDDVSYVTILQ
jgi:hypothetical protein